MTSGCGSSSSSSSSTVNTSTKTQPQVLTIQDLAKKNSSAVGELNKMYRLDIKNKYSDGTYMTINFQSVSSVKSATKGNSTFNNFI